MNQLTKQLINIVKFRSITQDKATSLRLLLYIKKELKGLPLNVKIVEREGYSALIATTKKTKKLKVLLQAHIDVVGGSDKIFKPVVKNGKIFGRGVFDMKYAAASYIQLFQELGQNLKNYDLGLMLTSDEEIGGQNGVGQLLKEGFKPQVCVLPDGGQDFKVQLGSKGVYRIKVQAKGITGHASRPWVGKNAISLLMQFLQRLESKFQSELCKDPKHAHNTINIGMISGGREVNSIPDLAEAQVDIRFTPDASKKSIEKLIASSKLPGIEVECTMFAPAFHVNRNNKFMRTFLGIYEEVLNQKPEFLISHGSSDARYFSAQRVPVISFRPVGGGHHSEGEWLDVESLEKFHKVLSKFVQETAN